MKVILQQNVQKLGKVGDVVETSPGYFRNFLQPRKLAVLATDGTLKKRDEELEALRKKAESAHQQSVQLAERITALGSLRLQAKTGEGGKLYGKITNKEIAQALQKELGMEIDKRLVKPVDDIGALGTYKVIVKLAPEVQAEISVEVAQEGTVAQPKPIPAASAGAADVAADDVAADDEEINSDSELPDEVTV